MSTLNEQALVIQAQSIDSLALDYSGAAQLILTLQTVYQNLITREESLSHLVSTIDPLARAIKVTSADDYSHAGTLIVEQINPALKEVDITYADLIALAYKIWKTLLARKASKAAPLEEDKMLVECEGLRWRKEEQAKAAEVARLARVEQERIARETQINRLKEQRAEEISLLMQQGQVDRAQEAISKVMAGDLGPLPKLDIPPIAPSYVAPVAPKVAGVALKTYWHFRVVDKSKLKPEYTISDDKLIQTIVTSKKKEAEGIVGEGAIEVWSDEGMATRGRK